MALRKSCVCSDQSARGRLGSLPHHGLATLLALLVGCGGSEQHAGLDGGSVPDGGTTTTDMSTPSNTGALPTTLPQIVPAQGTITQPHIVPIFFSSNLLRTQLVSYIQNYVARSASYAVLAEYGVTASTVGAAVTLSTAAPASVTDADIDAFIVARVGDGTFPAADGKTLYVLFYPQSTAITHAGSKSCTDFAAFHGWTKVGSMDAPYAIIPQCSSFTSPATLPSLTVAASHEITEAITDPVGQGWNDMNDPYSLWFAPFAGNEVADMCEWLTDSTVNESGIGISARVWSNAAMRNKKNPCLPIPSGSPSFFAVPFMPDLRTIQINTRQRQTELLTLTTNTPRTVEVRLSSDSPIPPMITVEAEEVPIATVSNPSPAKVLGLTWQEAPASPRVTAAAGSTVHLQVSASAAPASAYTTFRVYATITLSGGSKTQTMWAGQVNVR